MTGSAIVAAYLAASGGICVWLGSGIAWDKRKRPAQGTFKEERR